MSDKAVIEKSEGSGLLICIISILVIAIVVTSVLYYYDIIPFYSTNTNDKDQKNFTLNGPTSPCIINGTLIGDNWYKYNNDSVCFTTPEPEQKCCNIGILNGSQKCYMDFNGFTNNAIQEWTNKCIESNDDDIVNSLSNVNEESDMEIGSEEDMPSELDNFLLNFDKDNTVNTPIGSNSTNNIPTNNTLASNSSLLNTPTLNFATLSDDSVLDLLSVSEPLVEEDMTEEIETESDLDLSTF